MGKVFSLVAKSMKRSVQNINLENRAFKAISKEKPTPAPRHQSSIKYETREPIEHEKPSVMKQHLERLRQVFVVSEDVPAEDSKEAKGKNLPQKQAYEEDPEYGFLEPAFIPPGKFTLRQGIEFICKHRDAPDLWTASAIANEYRLDVGRTENVLAHFKAYELTVPKRLQVKGTLPMLAERLGQPLAGILPDVEAQRPDIVAKLRGDKNVTSDVADKQSDIQKKFS